MLETHSRAGRRHERLPARVGSDAGTPCRRTRSWLSVLLGEALANGRVNPRADRMALPVKGSLARSPNTAYVRKRGSMKIILEVPRRAGIPAHLAGRHRLRFTTEHPSSSYGLGVLLDEA
jgi:hypothetical protein